MARRPSARRPIIWVDLEASYEQMARDKTREAEALAWAEALIGDVACDDLPLPRENSHE